MRRRSVRARVVALCAVLLVLVLLLVPSALSCAMSGRDPDDPRLAGVVHERLSAPTGPVTVLRAGDPEGPRLIFVHGTPGDAGAWLDYLADPVPGWESVALDRPGFGESAPAGAVTSLEQQAAAIAPLLVQRRGRWPILIGHSLGGPIVVRVATDHPDRVDGLLIVAGNLDPGLEELHWYNHVATLLEPLLSRPMRNSNRELTPLREELAALAARLPRLTCHVVLVHGTADRLVPYANVNFMQARFVNAGSLRLVSLPGADHFLPWTRQDVLREAIADLIAAGAAPTAEPAGSR